MNIKQLEALIFVNRHGTFKKAAEALYFESSGEEYITPESIQYRIKHLEQELGISLYRKRQGSSQVLLTREGQLFLKEALEVYQRMTEWRSMFLESPRTGSLTFATTQVVLLHRLTDVIKHYHVRHPMITIRAHSTSAMEMESMVAEGRVDFAISTRPPEDSELEYALWNRSELVLVTPLGHPLAKKKNLTLQDIAAHPLILLEPELRGDRELVDEAFRKAGIRKLNVLMETSNSEIIMNYVEAGLAVGLISETSLARNRRKVESVPLGAQIGRSEVGLLLRDGQYLSTRVREFITLLDPMFEGWLAERDERHAKQAAEGAARGRKKKKKSEE